MKATFEEFKRYKDDKVEQRCAKMDARLDKLSMHFDEELYPHMLTVIVRRRWVIGHGLRLAVMKCAESSELSIYPEADNKYFKALHDLKDLKYPLVDQLEKLKGAPIDMIMASLYLESDSGEHAPQWIREPHLISSQLKIPVYPKVRDPKDTWSFKEEILFEDAITANISRAKKEEMTGLAILLVDAATQTKISKDEASPRLLKFKCLPPMYNLDWPYRPPMLNKENYVPWSSRLLRYAKSRPNGKLINNSILNGPYVKRMIPEPGDAERDVNTKDLHTADYTQLYDFLKQIAQPGMNMGQDRKMQMVGGNGGNQFRLYVGQNVGNLNGYNAVQNVRNQKEEAGIQLQAEEYDLMAAAADLDEIKEVNANCILMANLQQASSSGTQTDSTPVYDTDGSAEVIQICLWCIDSGCSKHMTENLKLLINF
nr:transposase (putative), gypsy type [Tanacetum cinerariifolium]